jgi:DNA-binding NarL/FixJ family response regulator
VVLTSFSDQARLRDALRAGAVGYLLKDWDPRDLLAAIRNAADGHAPLDPRVARALLPGADPAPASDGLSVRETQVFRQLGVADRTSAALWAREHLAPE